MITVREIRIGDMVVYNDEYWYVRGIEQDLLKLENNRKTEIISPAEASPVALTENILIKLGFEVSDTEKDLSKPYREYNYHGMVISLFLLNEPVFLYCADDTFKGNAVSYSRPPLKYLHQLQNLFFVLTGKELNVDPLVEP